MIEPTSLAYVGGGIMRSEDPVGMRAPCVSDNPALSTMPFR
jgi:hypothetical protein